MFISIIFSIYFMILLNISISHLLGRPAYRFRKPDNYLSSRVQKKLISKLRRSATAPDGVANMKNDPHQDSIFHDASAFVKRGLTIKRLRSDELIFISAICFREFFFLQYLTVCSVPFVLTRHISSTTTQYTWLYIDRVGH